VYCGGKAEGLDHIRPKSHLGFDGWENRAPACQECDRLKGSVSLVSYLLARNATERKMKKRAHRYLDDQMRRSAWWATIRSMLNKFKLSPAPLPKRGLAIS
jgi:hypothetical protein